MPARTPDAEDLAVYPNGEHYDLGTVRAGIDAGTWPMSDDYEIVLRDDLRRLEQLGIEAD